jgi:hypothetical protein
VRPYFLDFTLFARNKGLDDETSVEGENSKLEKTVSKVLATGIKSINQAK